MSDEKQLSVRELAEHVDGEVSGDEAVLVSRLADLETAGEHDVAYVEDPKYFPTAQSTRAGCLIAPESFTLDLTIGEESKRPSVIRVPRPKLAFAKIAALVHPPK